VNSVIDGKTIHVVNDQIRTPTFVGDVVNLAIHNINVSDNGVFHIGGDDSLTVFDFAKAIGTMLNASNHLIQESNSNGVDGAMLRPINSCFNNKKVKGRFNLKPMGIIDGINASLQQMK
jgi:dTDP-4-dehydrorhamnose reductase